MNPKLIILDEPFSGLDPVNTEVLKQVIFEEKSVGATIIFSDHVMTNVEELCDDILMIRDGSVVLLGLSKRSEIAMARLASLSLTTLAKKS